MFTLPVQQVKLTTDALHLTGIGRNEVIDIMNKCRSKVCIVFPYYEMLMRHVCQEWKFDSETHNDFSD